MKIETSTAWLPIIDVCTYWGELSFVAEDLREDVHVSELDPFIVKYGFEWIKEVLEESIKDKVTLSDGKVKHPNEYNFSGDSLEFTMEIPSEIVQCIDLYKEEMYQFFDEKYGSHPGFISFMPYTKEKFSKAIRMPQDTVEFAKAISMYVFWLVCSTYSEKELNRINHEFAEDVSDDVYGNTDLIDYEEEE